MNTVEYLKDPGGQALYRRHVESAQDNPNSLVGMVLGHRVNADGRQTADVALLQYINPEGQPLILMGLAVTQDFAGPGYGIHRHLGKGVLVEVFLDSGQTRNARVGKVVPWRSCRSTSHPMVTTKDGDKFSYVVQAPIDDPHTPGALWGVFADGTVATIAPARHLLETSGAGASRTAGPAIQAAELKVAQVKLKAQQAQRLVQQTAVNAKQLARLQRQSQALQAQIARQSQTQGGVS